MRVLAESGMLFIALIVALCVCGYIYYTKTHKPSSPDQCKHKRWTRWIIADQQMIHLYAELDEGKKLPDRVDVLMTRECLRCGIPQAKTVRGIDSPHFK